MFTPTMTEELPAFLLHFKLDGFGLDVETSPCPATYGLALV